MVPTFVGCTFGRSGCFSLRQVVFFFSKSCKQFFRFEFPIFPTFYSGLWIDLLGLFVRLVKKSTCQTQINIHQFLPRPLAWHGICSPGSSGLKDGKPRVFPLTQPKWPPPKVPIWASHAKTRSDVKVWVFQMMEDFARCHKELDDTAVHSSKVWKGPWKPRRRNCSRKISYIYI